MKKIVFSFVVIILLSIGTAVAALESSTELLSHAGVVDMNRVAKESVKFQELQNQLNQKSNELSDKLEVDKANLSEEDFHREQQAAYGEIIKLKEELESQYSTSLIHAVRNVVLNNNLSIIFNGNSEYKGIDVTTEVINVLNGGKTSNPIPVMSAQYGLFDIVRLKRDSAKVNELMKQFRENQVDINYVKEFQEGFDDRIKRAVEKVSITKDLKIVDKYAVIYGGIDVTEDIINAFDNESD